MEKVDLIEGKELLQTNEKIDSKKNMPLVQTIEPFQTYHKS